MCVISHTTLSHSLVTTVHTHTLAILCVCVCVCVCVLAGRVLSAEEKGELVAAACYMHIAREDTAKQFLNQDRYIYT